MCVYLVWSHFRIVFFSYLHILFFSERTPLERCCVQNMSPFVSSSGLSPIRLIGFHIFCSYFCVKNNSDIFVRYFTKTTAPTNYHNHKRTVLSWLKLRRLHWCRTENTKLARPKFRGPRSASIACSQLWLVLPIGRFQSSSTCRIATARARWWSSRDELRAIWPKSHRRLLVTRWESGEQPSGSWSGSSNFRIWHMASIRYPQDLA